VSRTRLWTLSASWGDGRDRYEVATWTGSGRYEQGGCRDAQGTV